MIRDFARMIRQDHERRGRRVEVRADVWASVNGRPSRLLVDPEADLSRADEVWSAAEWILPYGLEQEAYVGMRDMSRGTEGTGKSR